LLSLVGLLIAGVAIIAIATPLVRRVELDLPDFEMPGKS
jgi:hypothetical protein